MNGTPSDAQLWAAQRQAALANAQALRAVREASEPWDVGELCAPIELPSSDERHLPCCTCSLCRTRKGEQMAPPSPATMPPTSPQPWPGERDDGGWSNDFTDLSKNGFDSLAGEKKKLEKGNQAKAWKQRQNRPSVRPRSLSVERQPKAGDDRKVPTWGWSNDTGSAAGSAVGMRAKVRPSEKADDGPSTRINFDKRTSRHMHAQEFQLGIAEFRNNSGFPARMSQNGNVQFFARKRPLFEHEMRRGEYDVVTTVPGWALVHVCGMAPDLQRMHINHNHFPCSESFSENSTNDKLHARAMKPLVTHAMRGGMATCLMYGATGSGKTYTMSAMQEMAVVDLCRDGGVEVVMLELAGKDVRDLLNPSGGQSIKLRDDAAGELDMVGITEHRVASAKQLLQCLAVGQQRRTTCGTFANGVSSRSHMVVLLRLPSGGTLVLVDCAGSERKEDSNTHTAERQKEGAEINASLHALKECIRALTSGASHVPYRMNNLTRVLRGSFTTPSAKFHVVATVAPGCSDAEHSLATLMMGCVLCGSSSKIIECKQEVGTIPSKRERAAARDRSPVGGPRARSFSPAPSHDRDNYSHYEAAQSSVAAPAARHSIAGAPPPPARNTARNFPRHSTPSVAASTSSPGQAFPTSGAPRPRPSASPSVSKRQSRQASPPPRKEADPYPPSSSRQAAPRRSLSPTPRCSGASEPLLNGALHPNQWGSDDLRSWLNRQRIAARLPAGADGRAVVRWSKQRWTEACGGDERAGLKVFNGLRIEMDRIAEEEKQWRKQIMKGR